MKGIITVLGKDTKGIIAKICMYLYEQEINILDISQTILQDYFNMIMIVDLSESKIDYEQLEDGLAAVAQGVGVTIKLQREDIFNSMHRI